MLSKKILLFLFFTLSIFKSPFHLLASELTINSSKRIISLNSLGADIVSQLDNESLIGIPGSSLLKKDDRFDEKVIVSEGRMPPSYWFRGISR